MHSTPQSVCSSVSRNLHDNAHWLLSATLPFLGPLCLQLHKTTLHACRTT
jgi:hypothetical protein